MERFFSELSKITEATENEPMKNHTTFKIGGLAKYFAQPRNIDELKKVVSLARKNEIKCHIIGRGSNILVSDDGVDGLVVALGEKFSACEVKGNEIHALSGVSLSSLSQMALSASLTGLEFASGIPGSLGGAIYMNAGAYGGEMKDVVKESTYLDEDFSEKKCENHLFDYRKSFYTGKNLVITSAVISLKEEKKEKIKEVMSTLALKRREKQPLDMPSAGSVFKRPEGHFAGALIESAGLKGYSIGGAQVSEKHAGFIVNKGGATCKDVVELIDYIKERVYKESNVILETEIKLL